MGIFDGIFNNKPQQQAGQAQIAGLNQGYQQASSAVNAGQARTDTDYAAALAPWQQNYATAGAGQDAYANATGVNGAAGYAKALENFHTSPGYDWVLNQGNQNILRGQSQSGQLASGGTNLDLLTFGQGLADQNWQKYVQNLQPFLGQANTSAAGISGTNIAKAGTDADFAKTLANLGWAQGTGIGNVNANVALSQTQPNANIIGAGMQFAKGLAGFLPI